MQILDQLFNTTIKPKIVPKLYHYLWIFIEVQVNHKYFCTAPFLSDHDKETTKKVKILQIFLHVELHLL